MSKAVIVDIHPDGVRYDRRDQFIGRTLYKFKRDSSAGKRGYWYAEGHMHYPGIPGKLTYFYGMVKVKRYKGRKPK